MQAIAQNGVLLAAEKTDRSQLSAYGEQQLYDAAANPFVAAQRAGSAGLVQAPAIDPTSASFHTIAQADYLAQDITFYRGFYDKGTKGRAQTLLHEGLHLFLNFSDQQLAQLARVPGANGPQASANFQRELENHCK